MKMRHMLGCWTLLCAGLLCPPAWAQEGQGDLDRAMDRKITAQTLQDLSEVAALCEAAIEKGLAPDDAAIARQLLAGALYERASQVCRVLKLGVPATAEQVKELRGHVMPDLEKILKHNPQFGPAHLLIAQLQALEGGDAERARKSADEAVERLADNHPLLAEALVLRSGLQSVPADALADLNRAVELAPDRSEVWQARALYELQQGNVEKAMADFNQLIEKNDENMLVRLAVAEALIKAGQRDEALNQINFVLEKEPSVLAYTLRAQVRTMEERLDEAVKDLDEAVKLDPDDLGLVLMRARVYETMGKFGAAAQDVATMLKIEPDNRLLKLQWAIYLNADNQSRQAIGVFDEVLSADPQNDVALRGRADAYLNVGEHRKAVADYEVVIKMVPDDAGVLNNFAWVLATSPDDGLRNGKRAVEMALKAAELTQNGQAHILSTLAAAYAETGDFDNAVKWSEKSVELGEKDIAEQLKQELDSYRQRKPWREIKAETPAPPAPPASDSPAK